MCLSKRKLDMEWQRMKDTSRFRPIIPSLSFAESGSLVDWSNSDSANSELGGNKRYDEFPQMKHEK